MLYSIFNVNLYFYTLCHHFFFLRTFHFEESCNCSGQVWIQSCHENITIPITYQATITIFQYAISIFYFIFFRYFISFLSMFQNLFSFFNLQFTMTSPFSNTFILKNRAIALDKYGSSHVMKTKLYPQISTYNYHIPTHNFNILFYFLTMFQHLLFLFKLIVKYFRQVNVHKI